MVAGLTPAEKKESDANTFALLSSNKCCIEVGAYCKSNKTSEFAGAFFSPHYYIQQLESQTQA